MATIRANVAVIMEGLSDASEFTEILKKIDHLIYEKEIELVKIKDIEVPEWDIPKLDEVAVSVEETELSRYFDTWLDTALAWPSPQDQLKEMKAIDADIFISWDTSTESPSREVHDLVHNLVWSEIWLNDEDKIWLNDVDIIWAVNKYLIEQAWDGDFTLYYISHLRNWSSKLLQLTYSTGWWSKSITELISPTDSYKWSNSGFESSKLLLVVRAAKDRKEEMEAAVSDLWDNSLYRWNDIARYESLFRTGVKILQLAKQQGNDQGFDVETFTLMFETTIQTYINIVNTHQTQKMLYINDKGAISTATYYSSLDKRADKTLENSLGRWEVSKMLDNPSVMFLREHYEKKLIEQTKTRVEILAWLVAELTEEKVKNMRPRELTQNLELICIEGQKIHNNLWYISTEWVGSIEEVNNLVSQLRWEGGIRAYLIRVIQQVNQYQNKWWFSINNKENKNQQLNITHNEVSNYANNANIYTYMDNVVDKERYASKDKERYTHHLQVLAIKWYEDITEQYEHINKQLSWLISQENKESTPEDLSVLAKNILTLKNNLATLNKVAQKNDLKGLEIYALTMEEQLSHTLQVIIDLHAKQGIASVDFQNLSWRATVPYLSVDGSWRIVKGSLDIRKGSKAWDIQKKINETWNKWRLLSPQVQLFFLWHRYTHLWSQITAMLASVERMDGKEFSSQVTSLEELQKQEWRCQQTLQSLQEEKRQYDTFSIDHKEYYQQNLDTIKAIIKSWMETLLVTYTQELSTYKKYGEPTIESIPQKIERSVNNLKDEEEKVNICITHFNKQGYLETNELSWYAELLPKIHANMREIERITSMEHNMNTALNTDENAEELSEYELLKKQYVWLSNVLVSAQQKTYTNISAQERKKVLIKSIEDKLPVLKQAIKAQNEETLQELHTRDLFQPVDWEDNNKYGVSKLYLDRTISLAYEEKRDEYHRKVQEQHRKKLIEDANQNEDLQDEVKRLNRFLEESDKVSLESLGEYWIKWDDGFDALVWRIKKDKGEFLPPNFDAQIAFIRDYLVSLDRIASGLFSERELVDMFLEEEGEGFLSDERIQDIPRDSIAVYLSDRLWPKYFNENNSRILSATMTEGIEAYLWHMPDIQILQSSRTSSFTQDQDALFLALKWKITELERKKLTVLISEIQAINEQTIEYIWAHSMTSYSDFTQYSKIIYHHEFHHVMELLETRLINDDHLVVHKDDLLEKIATIKSKIDQIASKSKILDLWNASDYGSVVAMWKKFDGVIEQSAYEQILEEMRLSEKAKTLCLRALEGDSPNVSWMMKVLGSEDLSEAEREKVIWLMSTYLAKYYQEVSKLSSDDTNDGEDGIDKEAVLTAAKSLLEKVDILSDSTWSGDHKVYIERKLMGMPDEEKIVDIQVSSPDIFSKITGKVD